LAVPLNGEVLRALDEKPRALTALRRALGSPPETTTRNHLRTLTQLGVLVRDRRAGFPGPVNYELGRAGADLLLVAGTIEDWLFRGPGPASGLGTAAGKGAVKALVDGWGSTLVRALAARPLALTELSRVITALNYPTLERRLSAMRQAGLLEPSANGRSTPHAVTPWLRQAVAPLVAAARWEGIHLAEEAPPIARIDVEAMLLLSVPLLKLQGHLGGTCRLTMELPGARDRGLAGVLVDVDQGRPVSCVTRLEGGADAWASGPAHAWLRAITQGERDLADLEMGGETELVAAVVRGLHEELFARIHS
jgi:DNA-binding HxlR family transcriptional regulator